MSPEAEALEEDVEDVEPAGEPEAEDKPALEDDEVADLGGMDLGDVTEEVQAETGDAPEADEEAESDDESEDSDEADERPSAFGDLYVETLAAVLSAVADEHGDGGVDQEELAEMARSPPFALDSHVDALAEEMVGGSDLPPGKAAVLMTALFCGMVLVKETDAAGSLVSEMGGALEEARN